LESLVEIPQFFVWVILFLAVLIIFIFLISREVSFLPRGKKLTIMLVVGFCLLFLVLGVARMQISEFNIANNKLSKLNGKGQIVLTGTIYSEPDVRDTYQKIKVKVGLPAQAGDSLILVTTNRYPEYEYLDVIKLIGKLETPGQTEDGAILGSYKNYLMKDGIYSAMNFVAIEKIGQAKPNILQKIYSTILWSKQKIRESIRHNFSPPQSSILEGTILGDNGAMTSDLKNKLNITGLRHIIAVSGTHVVILSAIIMSVLLAFGFWRGQAFYIALIFICIYIVFTGLPPSGVRAGIMGLIYLLSQKIGRQTMSSRLIALACALMLLINPLLLFYDVGFQLSFLAVLGLIYLEPLIKNFIKRLTKEKVEDFVGIFSTTFAAQIFTLPIMIYNFGNVSFVSPITNLLVLPIVYGLMVFGFLVSTIGALFDFLGWILSIPCWFLLTYFVKVIDIFSQPQMAKSITNVSWVWPVVFYLILGSVIWFLKTKYNKEFI